MTLLSAGLLSFFAGLIFWIGFFSHDEDFPAWAAELLHFAFGFALLVGAICALIGLGVCLAPRLS